MNEHISVLLQESIEHLLPKSGIIIDGTLGLGGHTKEILSVSKASVIGIDQDGEALEKAKKNLKEFDGRVTFVRDNFSNIKSISEKLKVLGKVSAILLDLGVSSLQLDKKERGFSFSKEGPLDMRMSDTVGLTAYEVVNSWPEEDIANAVYEFGEERLSRQIAKGIVTERRKNKIQGTLQLAEIIKKNVPSKYAFGKIHPATRTFQALRILVNDELGSLEKALVDSLEVLTKNGRLVVISFHSLEDRIVKRFFKDMAKKGRVEILTKKPIVPTLDETRNNPRARSAKMRVASTLN